MKALLLLIFLVSSTFSWSQIKIDNTEANRDCGYIYAGYMQTTSSNYNRWEKRAKKVGATHYVVNRGSKSYTTYSQNAYGFNEIRSSGIISTYDVTFYFFDSKKSKECEEKRQKKIDEDLKRIREKARIAKEKDKKNAKWYIKNGSLISELKYEEKSGGKIKTIKTYDLDTVLNGPSEEYYKSGILLKRVFYNNGLLEGIYKVYSTDGKISFEREYKNGLMDGYYRNFKDGKISYELEHKNGLRDGYYRDFKDEKISYELEYKNGLRDGYEKHFFDNGKLKSKNLFKKDKEVSGTYDEYYDTGVKIINRVRINDSTTMAERFFRNGESDYKTIYYDNGLVIQYNPDGSIGKKGKYGQYGNFTGTTNRQYLSGINYGKLYRKGTYINGKFTGEQYDWFFDELDKIRIYKDGKYKKTKKIRK